MKTHVTWLRFGAALALTIGMLVGRSARLAAQSTQPATDSTAGLSVSGFVHAALFWQDRSFAPADGSSALYVADSAAQALYGGDVRDTRIALDLRFPQLPHDWKATGLISMDFFGGFKGDGTFAFVQPRPRIRNAIVTLTHAGTSISAGQINPPIFAYAPVSTSHPLTFPLGLGSAGLVGLYSPGLKVSQTFAHHGPDEWQVTGAVLENQWKGIGGFDNVVTPTALSPQLQARLDYQHHPSSGTQFQAFVAGHWDHKNVTNLDSLPNDGAFSGWLGEGGLKLRTGEWTFQGSGYYGHAVGQQLAQIFQFGNFSGWGAWAQAGWDFAPHLGLWGYGGISRQDRNSPEVQRPANLLLVPMLRFQQLPIEVGLEWLHARTDWYEGVSRTRVKRAGNQIALSTLLHF